MKKLTINGRRICKRGSKDKRLADSIFLYSRLKHPGFMPGMPLLSHTCFAMQPGSRRGYFECAADQSDRRQESHMTDFVVYSSMRYQPYLND